MPSISAAWVRFPSVSASVFSRCSRSTWRIGVPATAPALWLVALRDDERLGRRLGTPSRSSCASISSVSLNVSTRRMKFASSRTLPGHECDCSRSRNSGCSRGGFDLHLRRVLLAQSAAPEPEYLRGVRAKAAVKAESHSAGNRDRARNCPRSTIAASETLVVAITRISTWTDRAFAEPLKLPLLQSAQQLRLQVAAASRQSHPAGSSRHPPVRTCPAWLRPLR